MIDDPRTPAETQSCQADSDPRNLARRLDEQRREFAEKPDRIGPYKILQVLGEGGMGIVYLAEQTKPIHRRVALKIIKLGMDTKQVIARFETEREALALMNHPNVARVYDAGATETGRPYFVMEHVPGIPITEYCDKHRLTTEERLRLFMDVCHAVQHAHQKGIIHRDIKPSNVLVTVQDDKPIPKVIDFGVAKATQNRLTEQTLFTEQGQLVGTPGYMSPEQAEMSALDIDTRTDIYSLGVLLYQLLVGALPFGKESLRQAGMAEIQRIIREVDPPKPSTKFNSLSDDSTAIAQKRHTEPKILVRQLRGDLDWIVMKCLEKDRRRRYDTANGLAMEVQRFLNDEPVMAGPPSAVYRVKKFVRRNKLGVAAAVVFAVVLVAGLVGTSYGLAQAVRARVAEAEQRRIAESRETEAQAARAEAEQRSRELEQVGEFQASQLSGIDVQHMGVRLRDDLLADARGAMERTMAPADEIAAMQEQFEKLLSWVNLTNVALKALDRNIFERALATVDERFKDQQLVQARLLHTLADTLRKLGLLDKATDPQKRALEIHRRELGADHLDTLASINNMGLLLQSQGKPAEAEPYFREALKTSRRVLGGDHPDTLNSISNMGYLLDSQGKLSDAEPYYREAMETSRRVLGDDHSDTLNTIGNMGVLLQMQGKLAEALPYYREALETRRHLLGDDHPDTLISIGNMGALLQAQGKPAEAEPYFREAMETSRRVLGDDHPDTLNSTGNMGYLLQSQGKLAEAEPYYREALEGKRHVLGDDHPYTLMAIGNMGSLLNALDKFTESALLLADGEPAARRAWPGGNAGLLGSYLTKLGEARTGLGEFAAASTTLLEAHRLLTAGWGKNDARTVKCAERLIALYETWNAAEPGKGYAEKAAEYRKLLESEQATSQPQSSTAANPEPP